MDLDVFSDLTFDINKGIPSLESKIKLKSLFKSSKFKRQELADAISLTYCGSNYGDNNWNGNLPECSLSSHKTNNAKKLLNLYPNMSQLSLYPGVMSHVAKLIDFLENNNMNGKNHIYVYKAFKEYLGKRTMYRGMALSDSEAKNIEENGIESAFIRDVNSPEAKIKDLENTVLSLQFSQLIDDKLDGINTDRSPLISLTPYKDVALAVGFAFGFDKIERKKGNMYVYKLKIPEIDIIRFNNIEVSMPYKYKLSGLLGYKLNVTKNGKVKSYNVDEKLEQFVMYKINPSEIVDVNMTKDVAWHHFNNR